MGLTNFDELNTLSTTETTKDDRRKAIRKKIPIHDYFENMQISEEEKEKRVRLANLLLADVLFLFALSRRNRDTRYLSETFQKRYLSSVKKVTEPDQKMQRYIRKVCDSIVKTTLKSGKDDGKKQGEALTDSDVIKVSQDSYAVSIERATSVAENEANTILNGEEYSNAVKNGCTKKRWKSYRDERVRADHADVDGQVVDISRPFRVGKYMMMYPKDDSLGAGLEEIVNCRCSVEYIGELHEVKKDTEEVTALKNDEKKEDSFVDVTREALESTEQGSVEELQSYDYDGITYVVDGKNVQQNNSNREIEIAQLLKEQLGKNVKIVPEIKGKYKNIPTPDYLINQERWDLKELKSGTSAELLRNIAHKKKKQAENFIFDITECSLSEEEINRQAECLFNEYYNTKHVNYVVIIKDDQILRVMERKK